MHKLSKAYFGNFRHGVISSLSIENINCFLTTDKADTVIYNYVQKSKLEQVKLAGEQPEQIATSHDYFQQHLLMKLRTTRHTRECLKRYLLRKTVTDICV
jgi:hypothetical protein